MKKLIFISILCLFILSNIYSQEYKIPETFGGYITTSINEGLELAVNPIKWNSEDYLKAGLALTSTYLISTHDKSIQTKIYTEHKFINAKSADIFNPLGEGYPGIAISAAFYSYGYLYENSKSKLIGFEILQSMAYTAAIITVTKIAFGRTRPYASDDNGKFNAFALKSDNWSFPSGHTSDAFAVLSVLSAHTDNYLYKALIIAPGIFTAGSRIYSNKHWASDVFLGGLIGYYVGNYIVNSHNRNETKTQLSIIGTNGPGLYLTFKL